MRDRERIREYYNDLYSLEEQIDNQIKGEEEKENG